MKHYQSKTEEVHADRTIGFRCDSLFSIINMISASHLVGYIPEVLYEKYRDVLRLKKVDAPFMLPQMEVFMVYNRSALNSSVFSKFVEQIAQK